jgi:DNA-binding CsgD family transcriptional regulator
LASYDYVTQHCQLTLQSWAHNNPIRPRKEHASPVSGQQPALGLEPWREAIRGAADAVGLVELPSTRFIELSPRAKELVGSGSHTGLELLTADDRAGATAITRAAAAGVVDGTETQRRHWQRPDGSAVEVTVRSRAIRLKGESFGLWVARELSLGAVDGLLGSSGEVIDWRGDDSAQAFEAYATLDDVWRVRRFAGEAGRLSDVLVGGTALVAVTHPDDMARLLFAFAGATTDVGASVRLRLLSDGAWIAVDTHVSRVSDRSWRLALASLRERETAAHVARGRAADLERRLRRIAAEVRDAGVVTESATADDILRVPGVNDLPERQREIVLRLARAERVGTIATNMYLSPSTVRNHLSAVFRKFGVHSQQELLVLLHGDAGAQDAMTLPSGAATTRR